MATDWTKLRLEYINSSITLQELADKHGIKAAGCFTRSAKEGWDAKRKEAQEKASRAAQAKIEKTVADELAEFNKGDLVIAKAIRGLVSQQIAAIQKGEKKASVMELRTLASAGESAQKIGRLALGVTTNNQGVSNPDGTPLTAPSFQVVWGEPDDEESTPT